MTVSKQEVRDAFRQRQRSFSAEQYRDWNRTLATHFPSLWQIPVQTDLVAAYRARATEASLDLLFVEPKRFCFPRITTVDRLEFLEVEHAEDAFAPGGLKILEPTRGRSVRSDEIGLCLIPLLAFDGKGMRMGQGKGHYDRFLVDYRGPKVGVAFSWQEFGGALPVDPHDQRLDYVLTEKGLRSFA